MISLRGLARRTPLLASGVVAPSGRARGSAKLARSCERRWVNSSQKAARSSPRAGELRFAEPLPRAASDFFPPAAPPQGRPPCSAGKALGRNSPGTGKGGWECAACVRRSGCRRDRELRASRRYGPRAGGRGAACSGGRKRKRERWRCPARRAIFFKCCALPLSLRRRAQRARLRAAARGALRRRTLRHSFVQHSPRSCAKARHSFRFGGSRNALRRLLEESSRPLAGLGSASFPMSSTQRGFARSCERR